ncbi:DUF7281 domain-containing protein [Methylocaldum sp. MU1018]
MGCPLSLDQVTYTHALVLYRGDPRNSSGQAVNECLRAWKRPALALVDLDPAGLLIAQALPFVVGLIAPDVENLESLLEQGNPKLYHQQRPMAEQALRNSPQAIIRQLWALIECHQKGVVQERWLHGDVELIVHTFRETHAELL